MLGTSAEATLQEARNRMAMALQELRSNNEMSFVSVGTIDENGVERETFVATSIWRGVVNDRLTMMLEHTEYENGVLLRRIVGDGTFLWSFDARAYTYSSVRYGALDEDGQFADHVQRLFSNFRRRVGNLGSFHAVLTHQAFATVDFAPIVTSWYPWIPTENVETIGSLILAKSRTPVPSELGYSMLTDNVWGWRLTAASFQREALIGTSPRVERWTMTPYRNDYPAGTSFQFIPPRDARRVTTDLPTGG